MDSSLLPKLELRLFGPPQVSRNGVLIAKLTSAKAQALLYYLAMTGRVHTRAALAGLLWGGHGEEEARANLRKAVQQLREQLFDHLAIERETIQVRAQSLSWVDAREFAGRLAQGLAAGEPEPLHQAVALYRGDFLEGFYVRDAPEFEAWMLAERARLRELLLQGLATLAERYASGGDLSQAITTARRLLELEPWREEVHRQLMEWLVQNGQRSAALAQYEICCRALAEELAVEPSPATRQAYERLLREEVGEPAAHVARQTITEYALVGRKPEWQTLRAAWHGTLQRGAQLVCIAGEPGIGKTRLAEELLVHAQRQGYLTARTRSYALDGRLAYGPVADWLRTESLRPHVAQLESVWLSDVARLLPELLVEHPDLPPPEPLTEAWQRKRLFEALVQAFTISQRPLLLLLDDLQWCDADTLEWVQYLLGAVPQAKMLLVGTVRSEEVEEEHPLHKLWHALLRTSQLTTIQLEPLTVEETAALGAQVAQHALDADSAGQLYRETTGNPLFVVESIRASREQVDGDTNGKQPVGLPYVAHHAGRQLPPKVYGVIQARLAQLSPVAHTLARLAAVVGRAFTVDLLVQAGQQDEETVMQALDELWRRRLVREQERGSYDFSHDRIREVAYAELSPIQRRLLHRQTAQALERVSAANLDQMSGQVAAHYELAGLTEQAVHYYQQAASAARQIYAHREVIHYLQRGLTLLRSQPGTPTQIEQELALQVDLASTLMDTHGWASPEAEQAYAKAFELCQQAEKTEHLFPTLWGLHEVYLFQAKYEPARIMAEQCMEIARRVQDSTLLLQAHHAMWSVLALLAPNELGLSLAHTEAGIALYDPQQHHTQLYRYGNHDPGICALNVAAGLLWLLGYPDQSHHRAQEALRLGYQLAHPFSLVIALNNVADHHVHRRELDRVLALTESAITLATEREMQLLLAQAMVLHGWALAMQGSVRQGVAEVRQGLANWRSLGITVRQSFYLSLLAEVYTRAGEIEAGLTTLDEALAAADATGEWSWESEIYRLRGELYLAAGRAADEAEAEFRQALQAARQQQAKSLELRAAMSLSRLWQQQGKVAEAQRLLSEIYGWFTEGFDTADLKEAKTLLDEFKELHP